MNAATAERLQTARDLKNQISELAGEDEQEVIIRDTSPRRRYVRLYSMVDGEPLTVAEPVAIRAIEKKQADGSYMFTAREGEAPVYKLGEIKCFLHADSIERRSGALAEVGLGGISCPAEHLASLYAKRMHAKNRHGQQWLAYQEHVGLEKERASEARQEQQLNATLALAGLAKGRKGDALT